MSVRHLTAASSEKITLGLGTLNYAFGPGTVAAVVRPASIAAAATILSVGSATTAMFEMRISAAGKILLGCNNTFPAAPAGLPAMTANAWFFAAATKATGTVAPKYHLYVYSTLTWTHIASAATVANSTAAGTRAALGTGVSGAATFWDGDIAAAGAWNVELTDSQIQDLLLFQPVPSKGMWSLNQDVTSGTLLDITGGGADQTAITGTSITSVTQPVGMANLAPPKPFEPWYLSRQAVNLAANFQMPNQFGPTFVESTGPGASLAYTPTLTQSVTVTYTATYTHFIQFGKMAWVWLTLTVTGAGTTNNAVVVNLPIQAVSANQQLVGTGYINDASPATNYPCEVFLVSATTMNFYRTDSGASGAWGVNPNLALAAGDTIYAQIVYETV